MTTATPHAADLDSIVQSLVRAGYPQRAIEKVVRVLRNHAPRAGARAHTNTNTNTNPSFDDLDEAGRMLDLTAGRPPAWAEKMIRRGLAARGIPETEWIRAWMWFRSWNLDSQGKLRIAGRALMGWIKTCKLRQEPKPPAAPKAPKVPPAALTPEQELTLLVNHASYSKDAAEEYDLVSRIGREEYLARIELMVVRYGCTRARARMAVHGEDIMRGRPPQSS